MKATLDIRLLARLRPPVAPQTAVGLSEPRTATVTRIGTRRPAAAIIRAARPDGGTAA
jgi:hypothetical protein